MILTLKRWPLAYDLDLYRYFEDERKDEVSRSSFQKLEHEQDRQTHDTQTDATERITAADIG